MRNGTMFARLLASSLKNRRTRIAAAAIALLLGVSLVSTLAAISLDARGKMGRELRAYGANILLSPKSTEMQIGAGGLSFGTLAESEYLPERSLDALQSDELRPHLLGDAPYLYGIVEVNQQKVVLVGTSFEQVSKISPWWAVTGRWPEATEEEVAIIGVNVAKKLGMETGQSLTAWHGNRQADLTIVGVVETGAAEDSQVFVNLGAAQKLLDKPELLSMVQISALTERQPVSATAAEIQKRIPAAKVTILSQIADAESSVVSRVELLMLLVSALVLLASALTVASTMMTAVMERTKEIGLMKALGASEARIASIFLAEAAAIGCLGGILGFGSGLAIVYAIGQTVFGSAISVKPAVLPLSLAVAFAVALGASALPVKRATRIDPAVTLRGE